MENEAPRQINEEKQRPNQATVSICFTHAHCGLRLVGFVADSTWHERVAQMHTEAKSIFEEGSTDTRRE